MPESIIRRHLEHAVYEALNQEQVQLHHLSREYLVSMLASFIDVSLLGIEEGMPVLTWLYQEAQVATGPRRTLALKKLGDIALFLSGIFVDYVRKTINGLGYYIDMGRVAYLTASQSMNSMKPIFAELSEKFIPLVGVLNIISIKSSFGQSLKLDDLFELYVRDSSNVLLQQKIMGKGSISIINTVGLS